MKQKGLWTILLVFGFLFSVFFLMVLLVVASAGSDPIAASGVGLGVVEIQGPIMDSRQSVEQIEAFERADNIKGIIVRVDSPGGAVAPSQEIHRAVLRARKKKKVVISMGSMAASGGYYIACGGDRVFALPGTVTGSIGVVTQLTNIKELAELARVDVHTITSGQYKDTGNPFRDFTDEDRAFFEQMIQNIYGQFVEDIAQSRGMKVSKVRELADGRVYTGQQAHDNGLVDELGGLRDAADWLAAEVGLEGEPKLIYPPARDEELMQQLLQGSIQSATSGVVEAVREQATPRFEYRYVGPR